jgi:hypothetical protein
MDVRWTSSNAHHMGDEKDSDLNPELVQAQVRAAVERVYVARGIGDQMGIR